MLYCVVPDLKLLVFVIVIQSRFTARSSWESAVDRMRQARGDE